LVIAMDRPRRGRSSIELWRRQTVLCCAELYCGASFTESCELLKVWWERLWTGKEEPGAERGMHVFPMLSRGGRKAMIVG
jgi:hypothetical protein